MSDSAPAPAGSALIVDDVPYIRKRLADTLSKAGWRTIVEAATGREALSCLVGNRFDLILLDVALPDVNGIELISAVRRLNPGIVVAVVTAAASAHVVREARLKGARSVFVKPVDPAYFAAFLEEVREGRAPR